jgi:hypothetical protein
LLKLNELERISRCRQRLGQQWIRVERNRRDQRIELIRGYFYFWLIITFGFGNILLLRISLWFHATLRLNASGARQGHSSEDQSRAGN